LIHLLKELKKKTSVNVLSYDNDSRADFNIKSYGVKDKLQRLAYKVKFSKFSSLDIKIMSEYDIIHIQHSYLFRKVMPFFKDLKKKPKIVITLRGADTYKKPWVSEKWREFYKENSQYISAFIVMSNHQKKYVAKWGVSEDKIHCIPISFGDKSTSEPKFPSQNTLKLVSAFRMCWEKNIEGSVRLAKILKEKKIPFSYDLYGDGDDLTQLYYLRERNDLMDEINIKHKIDNIKLKQKLTDYDFFIQLSISEALPTSVLEAQSKGVPCVVSNSDGLPEAVLNGKTAIVDEYSNYTMFANAIIEVWNNKEKYYSFSKEAIKNSNDNFSTEIEVDKLMNLYKSLMTN
ncbi:MAG: glycosyltransferase family 4 protein, partial [Flavobacteriaceae bacterium]|nr:glycosyltransferase family 4 protein [Flavobacteriaceae bacterium]